MTLFRSKTSIQANVKRSENQYRLCILMIKVRGLLLTECLNLVFPSKPCDLFPIPLPLRAVNNWFPTKKLVKRSPKRAFYVTLVWLITMVFISIAFWLMSHKRLVAVSYVKLKAFTVEINVILVVIPSCVLKGLIASTNWSRSMKSDVWK